jgi:hypothetical protein
MMRAPYGRSPTWINAVALLLQCWFIVLVRDFDAGVADSKHDDIDLTPICGSLPAMRARMPLR